MIRRSGTSASAGLDEKAEAPIPGRARFVAEMQPLIATGQLADDSFDRRRRTVDLAQIPDFTLSTGIGDRHRMLVLRRINPDKRFVILLHDPPSVHEARLGPPEQPSQTLLHVRAGRRPQPSDITSDAVSASSAASCSRATVADG